MKILAIDDDQDLLNLIKNTLIKSYQVDIENDINNINIEKLNRYDLIILDVMMPNMSGFDFLRKHRFQIDSPVIFLTAKDFEDDRLEGFASGGDDYITKPFSIKELRARVDAHIRREHRKKTNRLSDKNIYCDLIEMSFYVGNNNVPLTSSEYEICKLLLKHKSNTFSKENIYTSVYGYDAIGDSKSSITERVKNIRSKFEKYGVNPIKTVWGIGYKWEIENL